MERGRADVGATIDLVAVTSIEVLALRSGMGRMTAAGTITLRWLDVLAPVYYHE